MTDGGMLLHGAVGLLATFLLAASVTRGNAQQITCYIVPSVAGEFNCLASTPNFQAATIEECCVERDGFFFEGGGDEACRACIVFGFFNGPEITLPEQGDATVLSIGFIKGGNVQPLTSIDRRNTARFGITVTGSASPFADFTIQPELFQIEGPDARVPFSLTTFIRIDGVALEAAEDFILTLEGFNTAGRAIIAPTLLGQFVVPTIRVVIEDVDNAILQFLDFTYSNSESAEVIRPMVNLLGNISTDLTVAVVPVNYSEVIDRNLPLPIGFPSVPAFNPRAPNIATSGQDFPTMPVLITFAAGGATVIPLDIRITNDDINEVEQIFVLFMEVFSAVNPDRVDLRSGRFAALGRIIDDDPINIGFEQERYTVFEATDANGQLIPIPIIKENGQESELTFEVIGTLTLGSGPTAAQLDEDFLADPPVQRQPFEPDEQEIDYRFELFDDTPANPDAPEPTETFQIQLFLPDEGFTNINLAASGGSLFATATVVIIDNDDVIIGIEQNVTRVSESQSFLEVCVRVLNVADTVEFPAGFEVSLAANSIRGTAADPGDYTALVADSDIFFDIIDDETRRTCVEVEINDDNLLEGVEFFSIEVVPDPFVTDFPSNIRLDPALTFVEIQDNDFVVIGFNQTEYPVLETDRAATVYVAVLLGGLQRRVSVTFSTEILRSDSATAGADFVSLSSELVLDESTQVVPVEITIIDDSLFEDRESFTVRIVRDPDDPTDEVIVGPNTATVSIQADEPTVTFTSPNYVVSENNGSATVCVRKDLVVVGSFVVAITSRESVPRDAEGSSAPNTADFQIVTRTVTFTGDQQVACTSIPITDDNRDESREDFEVNLETPSNVNEGDPNVATVTIVDDDELTIEFDSPDYTVIEDSGNVTVCLITNRGIASSLMVDVVASVKSSSSNPASTADFVPATRTITFPVSTTASRVCTSFQITADTIALEGNEQFRVDFTAPAGTQTGVTDTACVTIIDDDDVFINFMGDIPPGALGPTYVVPEDNGMVTVCLSTSTGSVRDIVIEVTPEEKAVTNAATANEEFVVATRRIVYPASLDGTTRCTRFDIVDDDIALEGTETFRVVYNIVSPPGAMRGPVSEAWVDITENDDVTVEFEVPNYTVPENDGSVTVCVTTSTGIGQSFSIGVQTTPKTTSNAATSGDDFIPAVQAITFPSSPAGSRVCTSFEIIDEIAVENPEQFNVELILPSNVSPGDNSEACVTIIDDDMVTVQFTQPENTVGEADGMLVLTIDKRGANNIPLQVTITVNSMSATAGEDFTAPARTLPLPPGDDQQLQTLTVQIIDDSVAEGMEGFSVVLGIQRGDTDVVLGEISTTTVTIVDNDGITIGFAQARHRASEGTGGVPVTVQMLSGRLETTSTARMYTVDGVATTPEDYRATDMNLTFSSLMTTYTTEIEIVNDNFLETNEHFFVRLEIASSEVPVSILRNQTRIIITSDDQCPGAGVPVSENTLLSNDPLAIYCVDVCYRKFRRGRLCP